MVKLINVDNLDFIEVEQLPYGIEKISKDLLLLRFVKFNMVYSLKYHKYILKEYKKNNQFVVEHINKGCNEIEVINKYLKFMRRK